MKNLIKLNFIIWLIVYIIPTVAKFEVVGIVIDELSITIENIKEVEQSSRASDEREEVLHISEQGLEVLKRAERT